MHCSKMLAIVYVRKPEIAGRWVVRLPGQSDALVTLNSACWVGVMKAFGHQASLLMSFDTYDLQQPTVTPPSRRISQLVFPDTQEFLFAFPRSKADQRSTHLTSSASCFRARHPGHPFGAQTGHGIPCAFVRKPQPIAIGAY